MGLGSVCVEAMRNRYLQRGLLGLLVLQHDDVVPTTRAHSSSNTPGEGLAALRRPRASWAMGRALNRVPTTHRDTSPMHVISEHGTLLVAAALTVSVDARRRSGIRGGLIKAVRISTLTVAGRCCGRAALVCFGLARHVQREVRSGAWKFVVAARTAVAATSTHIPITLHAALLCLSRTTLLPFPSAVDVSHPCASGVCSVRCCSSSLLHRFNPEHCYYTARPWLQLVS